MTTPYVTTRFCADHLGVSQQFIRDEIHDGRLRAEIIHRPVRVGCQRARPLIRIPADAFRTYCVQYWPSAVPRLPAA